MSVRPWIVSTAFILLLAVAANLAWATGFDAAAPWYSPSVSIQVYSVALLAGTILAIVLTAFAAHRSSTIAAEIRSLNLGIAYLFASPESTRLVADSEANRGGATSQRLDDILATMQESAADPEWLPGGAYTRAVELARVLTARGSPERATILRQLLRERRVLRSAVAQMWAAVSGPIAVSVAFATIAATMLPGSSGFAQVHFQLNTTLILFLAYGFPLILAWSLLSVGWVERGIVRAT